MSSTLLSSHPFCIEADPPFLEWAGPGSWKELQVDRALGFSMYWRVWKEKSS